ncbi:MAG TPA: beta-galactosidase [Aggregatilinea sp.]|uniref:beta-galactosidase n=1 Tax=Aggregatilinea sp. TaxID=2806333 RepID=UPI002C1E937D|nr:beta-galactosidase [Aggregatilinea sp.]HML21411.1 beta-galactosidase [Aggregatilinea sp.]
MSEVQLAGKRLWVGDTSRALISGEMHYWRLSPTAWGSCLRRMRKLGLDIVSTYVPWEVHEQCRGDFDFNGMPDARRNVARFLELAARMNFWVIVRPGPYIYAEWANQGVPDRVTGLHRLHPKFLAAAEVWLAAVAEFMQPYLATNGGPVVLWQADNEPDAWPRFYEDQLGLADKPGVFHDFLRDHYEGDIERLNAAWESALPDFDAARAVRRPLLTQHGYINRYLDTRRFLYDYTTRIGQWTADTVRGLGIDVPLTINTYPWQGMQNWRALEATGDLAGPDYYAVNEFRRDTWEHQEFMHLMRYTRTYSALPFSPEFQAGIWHGAHYHHGALTPRHHRFMALSAMMAGIAGWNWYMIVNRDNWMMAPINEWGHTRPELFDTMQDIVALYREIDPPTLEKLTDTSIAFDILDRSSEIGGFNDGVLSAVYHAGVDYECYDLATGTIAKPLMFYSGGEWLSAEAQSRLLDYVEDGGHLVFFQKLPVMDETLKPLNRLNLCQPDGVLDGGDVILRLGRESASVNTGPIFHYASVPGQAIRVTRRRAPDEHADESAIHFKLMGGATYTVGYQERRGQGTITVLGLAPDPAVVLAVHRWLGVPVYAYARSPEISTAIFRRGDTFIVFAINNGDTDQDAQIQLHPPLFEWGSYHLRELDGDLLGTCTLRQTGAFVVRVHGKDGSVIEIVPAARSGI